MPPRGPRGPHGWEESSLSVLPFVGSLLLLLLILTLALTAFYLWRHGKLPLNLGRPRSPEEDAKRILAERFAQGDISSEEFMERSSILNWTPGAEPLPSRPRKRRS